MGNTGGCGNDDHENQPDGKYQDRVRANNYSRAYKGNKDDPRSNPYVDSEHKKTDQEKMKDQYQRPIPNNSNYDKYDPYKMDDNCKGIEDSANFYPRSQITSMGTQKFAQYNLSSEKQALRGGQSAQRLTSAPNYQAVNHEPSLPVKPTDKMFKYSQEGFKTLAKYPHYKLSLPAEVYTSNQNNSALVKPVGNSNLGSERQQTKNLDPNAKNKNNTASQKILKNPCADYENGKILFFVYQIKF